MDTAEKYFNLAIEKDPSYAPAYLGLAGVWIDRNQAGWSPPEIAGPKAKAAALRAIELDENSAHAGLAVIKMLMDWDWDGAWEAWRRAIELDPVVEYNLTYAQFLMIMGHGEEALIHGKRGVELDPLNPLARGLYAAILYFQRRYDEAIATAREALVLQPDFVLAWSLLSDVFPKKGMVKEALEAEKALCRLDVNAKRIEAALDEGYAQGGYAEAMKRQAEVLIACLPETFYKPSEIARCYAHAGEKSKALDWLEKGLEIHDPFLPYLGVPLYDDMRSDPRFQALLRKIGLPAQGEKR
jgi:tetratricopeptide (TPR) repeat protein